VGNMTWAYLAGFTDGDGCISSGGTNSPLDFRIQWWQTVDEGWVLVEIQEFLEGFGIHSVLKAYEAGKVGGKNSRAMARLTVHRRQDVLSVCKGLRKHLIVKQDKADMVISAILALPLPPSAREGCKRGHSPNRQSRDSNGRRMCLECRREDTAKCRLKAVS
jgi:hypothetical protein